MLDYWLAYLIREVAVLTLRAFRFVTFSLDDDCMSDRVFSRLHSYLLQHLPYLLHLPRPSNWTITFR